MKAALKTLGPKNVIVCTNKTDNGISNWQPSLLRHAKEFGVRAVDLEDCYSINDLIFISLEFDRIIKPNNFKSDRLYNIHFSKLPSYKGVYTSAWPILNGDTESGVTLHRIDQGIDTGEVIDQYTFELATSETARSLYFKYQKWAKGIFDHNIDKLLANQITSTPQPPIKSSYYGLGSINYRNLQIDTKNTAEKIGNQLRAFSFREYQLPNINGLTVGHYEITRDRSKLPAGTLTKINDSTAVLSTIDYDLLLHKDFYEELFLALDSDDPSSIEKAIKSGCNPNLTNKHGWSPLMISAFRGNLELCKLLIDMGADPNATNKNGTTVLMYAKDACIKTCSFELCDYLIKSGSDPMLSDLFGKTVLDHAKEKNQTDAVIYFEGFA